MNILGRSRSSMRIEIPGYKVLTLDYLVLDYNGTIATDGKIPEDVKEKIRYLCYFYFRCLGIVRISQTFDRNLTGIEKKRTERILLSSFWNYNLMFLKRSPRLVPMFSDFGMTTFSSGSS